MNKICPSYNELLKLILTNINELSCYHRISGAEIMIDTEYETIYVGMLTNLFTVYPYGRQYTTEAFRKFNDISYVDKYGIRHDIPSTKEEWFSFSMIHDCTAQDYENFIKIMEYISK